MSCRCATFSTSLASSLAPPRTTRRGSRRARPATWRAGSERGRWRRSSAGRPLRSPRLRTAPPGSRHLVGRDRGAGPRPARDDRLLGPPLGHVAGRRLAGPRPVVDVRARSRRRAAPARARAGAAPRASPRRRPSVRPRTARSASASRGQTAAIAGSRSSSVAASAWASTPRSPPRRATGARTPSCPRSAAPAPGLCRSAHTRRGEGPRGTSGVRQLPLPRGRAAVATACGADAVQRALELAESRPALGQVADHQERPLSADDLSRAADRTRGVRRHLLPILAQCFTN